MKTIIYILLFILIICLGVYIYLNFNEKASEQPHLENNVNDGQQENKNNDVGGEDALTQMINQMSIEEKIGQLVFAGISGTQMSEETKTLIHKYHVGGIILFAPNLENPDQSLELLNQIKDENDSNDLPIFLGVDQEGGRVERLPSLEGLPSYIEIASRDSDQFAFDIGKLLAEQLHAFGFNLNFAPVLDVNSNPNNPVIGDRSFGSDPEIVRTLGIQMMHGMQDQNIITAVKHFPGHGDTSVDSHFELPEVNKSIEELQKLELIPFKNVIEDGADLVMAAHILLPQIDSEFPVSMSEKVITGILRDRLEFDGVVITDDMTMQAITNHFEIGQAAVNSIKSGADIILMAHDYDGLVSVFDSLKEAVETGEITEERMNESVRRIIQLKWEYDIADEQVEFIDIEGLNESIKQVLDE